MNIQRFLTVFFFGQLLAGIPVTEGQDLSAASEKQLVNTVSDWVPPGFETLNEPQLTEIDVWFGGEFLASVLARFTYEQITFLNPDEISSRIPGLIDRSSLSEILRSPVSTNAHLICRSQFEIDCGTLSPLQAGVIFDRNAFRADVFLAPDLLEITPSRISRYLPDSNASMSLFNENRLFFSGSDQTSLAFNLSNSTQIGFAENRLLFRNVWTDGDGPSIDSLAFEREYRGHALQIGLVRADSNGLAFMNSEQFVGLSLESSTITRTDLDQTLGNEIVLFFSSRSRVEIYRDNQILYSGYYDVGNHTLETGSLPQGSYDIDIRITDSNGTTTTEQRYYSKNSRFAPIDQTLYFLQIGNLVQPAVQSVFPSQGEKLLRGGFSKRIAANAGFSAGFSSSEDTELAEASLFYQRSRLSIAAGLAYESDGTIGANLDLRFQDGNFRLDLDSRRIINGVNNFQLGSNKTQYSANAGYRSPYGYFNLFYRSNSRESLSLVNPGIEMSGQQLLTAHRSRNSGVRWNNNGIRLGRNRLHLSAEVSRNNDESLVIFGFTYSFRGNQGNYSVSPRLSRALDSSGSSRSRIEGNSNAAFQFGQDRQHRLNLRADRQQQDMFEARLETTGNNSASNISTRYDLGSGNLDFTGDISAGFAFTRDAAAFGSAQGDESAFLIRVKGIESDDSEYEVLVNGSPKGKARAGSTLLVPVAPYDSYRVELAVKGDKLVNLKSNSYLKTIYPGNVIALEWEAEVIRVAYGLLVDAAGVPISDAAIGSAGSVSFSDSRGYFQIELGHNAQLLEVKKGSLNCKAKFQQPAVEGMVVPLGTLTCNVH